jgi:hypothetical protein
MLLVAATTAAEVVGIDVRRRDDFGTHERIIARVHFAIDPSARANRGIADVVLAPRNAAGRVEFSSDLLFFMPKREDGARGTVFLEVVNRGRDQSLGLMSGARQRDLSPEAGTWATASSSTRVSRWPFSAGSSTCARRRG